MLDGALRACCMVGHVLMGEIEAKEEVRRRHVIDASSLESAIFVPAVICRGTLVVAKPLSTAKTSGAGSASTVAEKFPAFAMKLRRKVVV